MLHSFELWSCRCETNHFSTITSTTDCVVALVIVCSWDLWSFGRKPFCLWIVWTHLNVLEVIWTRLELEKLICARNESFWSKKDRFWNFNHDWNPVCYLHKNHTLVFVTLEHWERLSLRQSLAQARARETESVCWALFVVWSDLSERARLTFVLERKAFGKTWPR